MVKIHDLFSQIESARTKAGISPVFLCGGVPRDKYMGRLDQLVDLDITTGDATISKLGPTLTSLLPGSIYKVLSDNHGQLLLDGLKLDMSSNFMVPNIKQLLQQAGLTNPTNMQCELYSRDFTCNALLLSLDLKNIYDPTGLGIKDIKNKTIRTCLPAQLTLGAQPKRVVRILYLAAKLGFDVDKEIIEWVKKNPHSFSYKVKSRYLSEKLQKSLDADKEKTIELISKMNLWKYVPVLPDLVPYMTSSGNM